MLRIQSSPFAHSMRRDMTRTDQEMSQTTAHPPYNYIADYILVLDSVLLNAGIEMIT